jgi:hypothetical protein
MSRRQGVAISTMRRRLLMLEEWGWVVRLTGADARSANRARIQQGGEPCTRLPAMWGRGPCWLQISAEVKAVDGGLLAARVGVRVGRTLRAHHITLTCEIRSPPTVRTRPDRSTGGDRLEPVPVLIPRGFGPHGQVIHEALVECDSLRWDARLWEHDGSWSTATLTLLKECCQRPDVGQVHAFALELYEAAIRAMQSLEGATGARLIPMHLLDFCERVHCALSIEGPVAEWLADLPEASRHWHLADGRRVWGDFSDGAELESGLPSSGAADVLPVMDEVLAWALKDPEALRDLVLSVDALQEQHTGLEAAVARLVDLLVEVVDEPEPAPSVLSPEPDPHFMFS